MNTSSNNAITQPAANSLSLTDEQKCEVIRIVKRLHQVWIEADTLTDYWSNDKSIEKNESHDIFERLITATQIECNGIGDEVAHLIELLDLPDSLYN